MKVWFVEHCWRIQDYDGSWPEEWESGISPWRIFQNHEDAVDAIVKCVAEACDKKGGKVIAHDQAGDGWFYYEWEEEYNTYCGINRQNVMQISGYQRDVE